MISEQNWSVLARDRLQAYTRSIFSCGIRKLGIAHMTRAYARTDYLVAPTPSRNLV